jgi:hypothetical protein
MVIASPGPTVARWSARNRLILMTFEAECSSRASETVKQLFCLEKRVMQTLVFQ